MFGILKKKLKQVFKKTQEEIVEKPGEREKEKPEEKAKEKEEKEEKETKEKEESKGLFRKFAKTFTTTKIKQEDFDKFFSELEPILIENNIALEAIDFLQEKLKKELINKEVRKGKIEIIIKEALESALNELILDSFDLIQKIKEKSEPFIIVFFGINGTGKTTTIAKIAHLLKKNNLKVVLAASDTFRAASIEQLEVHAKNLNLPLIKHKYGSDPAAVAFDAIAHAKAQHFDAVLIDTAGRMHTKKDLMQEMEKISRVSKPDLKVFVGESITGNDSIEQSKTFNQEIGIDASILTKADIDEKGGSIISISYVTKKPILFLGTGQEYDKLKRFDKKEIIKNILS